MKTEFMKSKLKPMLKPKRYEHSIGVCDTAVKMAKLYGADTEKAYVAGLLHDCAKGFDIDRQKELCTEYGITLDKITLACPAVIHAPLGAEVARRVFGVCDEEILNAIRYHTVARANMQKLDKIIYIADMIEPLRDFDGVDILRKTAKKDLDRAFLTALGQSIGFNLAKNAVIHPNTLDAWNDMLIRKEETADGN